jgi:hypothetical protein
MAGRFSFEYDDTGSHGRCLAAIAGKGSILDFGFWIVDFRTDSQVESALISELQNPCSLHYCLGLQMNCVHNHTRGDIVCYILRALRGGVRKNR